MKSYVSSFQGSQDFKLSTGTLTLPVIFKIGDTPFYSLLDIWRDNELIKEMILLYIHLHPLSPTGKQWYRVSNREKWPCVTPKLLNRMIYKFNI